MSDDAGEGAYTPASPMDKQHLTWRQVEDLSLKLAAQLPGGFDALLVITRGGMVPACIISERVNLRSILVAAVMFYTDVARTLDQPVFLQFPSDPLLNGKRILVVDDVWDSGKTIMAVRERVLRAGGQPTTAVLHYKPTYSKFPGERPDFYVEEAEDWIVYPWDAAESGDPLTAIPATGGA